MKTQKYLRLLIVSLVFYSNVGIAQQKIANYRTNDKEGINIFESPKDTNTTFDGLKIRVGGDFAMQFQGISQTNSGDSLTNLNSNFNLPTANLNIDAQLADGLRMHIRTYLSSKHHTESYVKGGYFQIDKLDFVSPGLLKNFMKVATIRLGMDEINYVGTCWMSFSRLNA